MIAGVNKGYNKKYEGKMNLGIPDDDDLKVNSAFQTPKNSLYPKFSALASPPTSAVKRLSLQEEQNMRTELEKEDVINSSAMNQNIMIEHNKLKSNIHNSEESSTTSLTEKKINQQDTSSEVKIKKIFSASKFLKKNANKETIPSEEMTQKDSNANTLKLEEKESSNKAIPVQNNDEKIKVEDESKSAEPSNKKLSLTSLIRSLNRKKSSVGSIISPTNNDQIQSKILSLTPQKENILINNEEAEESSVEAKKLEEARLQAEEDLRILQLENADRKKNIALANELEQLEQTNRINEWRDATSFKTDKSQILVVDSLEDDEQRRRVQLESDSIIESKSTRAHNRILSGEIFASEKVCLLLQFINNSRLVLFAMYIVQNCQAVQLLP